MRRAARPHSVKDAWNDDLASGIWSKSVILYVSTIAVFSRGLKVLPPSRQTNASFQVPFQRPQVGFLQAGVVIVRFFCSCIVSSWILMYIHCLLTGIRLGWGSCCHFYLLHVYPRFPHFSPPMKSCLAPSFEDKHTRNSSRNINYKFVHQQRSKITARSRCILHCTPHQVDQFLPSSVRIKLASSSRCLPFQTASFATWSEIST